MRPKALPDFNLPRTLRAPALAGLLLLSGGSAQANDCDCACQVYEQILASIEVQIDDHLTKLNRCGGACAIAWARCEDAWSDSHDNDGMLAQDNPPQDNDPDQPNGSQQIATIKASTKSRSGNSPR